MRIGVDACCWSNKRGFGRFTRELLNSLIALDEQNEYWLFVDQHTAASCEFPSRAKLAVASTDVAPTEAASASGSRSLGDLWAMSRLVLKHKLDVFFFPAVYSYFPILNRAKIVVTIHDMIPESHPTAVFPNRRRRLFWNLKQSLAIRQADLILTVSDYSKREILKHCHLADSRVRVIPEGPGRSFTLLPGDENITQVLRRFQIDPSQPLLLYVGGISPHKNLQVLVEAFSRLVRDPQFSNAKLLLVGDYEHDSFYSDYPARKQQVEQLGLTDKVTFTGFVEDKDLASLYNAASLLVIPSMQEGFGLPAIEAMACGTPVAASNVGSLPEVLGDAGLSFDPSSPDQLLDVLRKVLSDHSLREDMKRKGLDRAKQFSWDQASRMTLAIFRELVER